MMRAAPSSMVTSDGGRRKPFSSGSEGAAWADITGGSCQSANPKGFRNFQTTSEDSSSAQTARPQMRVRRGERSRNPAARKPSPGMVIASKAGQDNESMKAQMNPTVENNQNCGWGSLNFPNRKPKESHPAIR